MNRTAMLVLTAVLMTGAVSAYPAIGGGRGLFRVQNALVESDAGLTISFHALGRNPMFPGSNEKGWVADLIAPELNYAPLVTKYVGLELFGSWGGVFQYPKEPGETKKFDMGLHDLKAGAKVSVPIIPVLKLGFGGSYTFLSDRDGRGWLDPTALPQTIDPAYKWIGMATLRLQDVLTSAPNLMVNYSQTNVSKTYGAGIELAATGFALFAEAQSLQPDSTTTGFFDTEHGKVRLTPGVAFGTGTSGLTLKTGYTFSWGPDAVNEFLLGLVIATPFGKRVPAQLGAIAGTVTDFRTGRAVAAKVTFPENPRIQPLTTDALAGVFTVERVPAGVVVVRVEADGYHSQTVPINVTGSAVSQYQFALRPLVTYGVIAGLVNDAATNRPLAAQIAFPNSNVPGLESEATTGSFRVDNIPVGVYTVTATTEGYFPGSQTVQVEEGRVASPTFSLRPLTTKTTITGKVSDKKTNEPLAAEVSFPGSGLPSIITDPGTGVYMSDVPVGSYAVRVSAQGYLDQTAAVALEENKPLIKDFQLVKEGMTITLRGIYFDVNKATIKPESRPALEDAAKILQENPSIKVEIQGHTDSDGSDSYNLQLSDRRAQSVVTYLIQNFGIAAGRLIARGYGESQPVAPNTTPEGKTLNRRVEFVILSVEK